MELATAADAARLLRTAVAGQAEERLAIAYLDQDRRLLHVEVTVGGAASAPVDTRGLAQDALRLGAAGLIMAHNHPGGDPRPSAEDVLATRLVSELAQALGLKLHDHLIFAGDQCHSMRASGLL